jgi:hypothetical protein
VRSTEIVPIGVDGKVVHVELSVPAGGDVSVQDVVADAVALQEQIATIATWVTGTVTPRCRGSRVGWEWTSASSSG